MTAHRRPGWKPFHSTGLRRTNLVLRGAGSSLVTMALGSSSVFPSNNMSSPFSWIVFQLISSSLVEIVYRLTKNAVPSPLSVVWIDLTILSYPKSTLIQIGSTFGDPSQYVVELRRLELALLLVNISDEAVSDDSGTPYSGLDIKSKVSLHDSPTDKRELNNI